MGRKRSRTGKHVLCFVTIITCLAFIGCASSVRQPRESAELEFTVEPIYPSVAQSPPRQEKARDQSKEHLVQGKRLLALGQYEASIRENLKVLSVAPKGPPGDEAIFTIGLIYAYPKYQKRDHGKAVTSLTKIIKEYPESNWSGHARILLDLIQENERLKKVSSEATHENEKLRNMIEQSKRVDLEVEEKKRDKAR